jgi:ABC-type multidrug transport system ATPase subunit
MLVVEGLTRRFGAKAAVDNASFSIASGDCGRTRTRRIPF